MAEANPSHLKLEYLKKYAKGSVFVETGTYHGDTIRNALEHGFSKIYSIEIDDDLYNKACEQFKNRENVILYKGDSVDIIPEILKNHPNDEITFWLDAHASGPLAGGKYPCPLIQELEDMSEKTLTINSINGAKAEQKNKPYVIFIDDRRLLGTAEWGMVQEQDVLRKLMEVNNEYKFYLEDGHVPQDIIVATTEMIPQNG